MGFTVPWAFGQPGMGVWEELGEKGKPSGCGDWEFQNHLTPYPWFPH